MHLSMKFCVCLENMGYLGSEGRWDTGGSENLIFTLYISVLLKFTKTVCSFHNKHLDIEK